MLSFGTHLFYSFISYIANSPICTNIFSQISAIIYLYLGHTNTMTVVLGAFGIRLVSYSLLSSPWLSLPIGM